MSNRNRQGCNGVEIGANTSIERALKMFGRITAPIVSEYKQAMDHYEKPSQIRHQKEADIRRQRLRDQREVELIRSGKKIKRKKDFSDRED